MTVPKPPTVFVYCTLPFVDSAARDKGIRYLTEISKIAYEKEPGVSKYVLTVPRPDDGKTLVMIEEYQSARAQADHIALPKVQELIQFIKSEPTPFTAPPALVLSRPIIPDLVKPKVEQVEDPYILIAEVSYHDPRAVVSDLPFWNAVRESAETKEDGTLSYFVSEIVDEKGDPKPEEAGRVVVLESYADEDALKVTHVASPAVQDLMKKGAKKSPKLIPLKKLAGFLYKPVSPKDQKSSL